MSPAPKFGVWCRVEGGITGKHEGWMKVNGEPLLWDSQIDAQQVVDDTTRVFNGPYRVARFTYTVKPYPMETVT